MAKLISAEELEAILRPYKKDINSRAYKHTDSHADTAHADYTDGSYTDTHDDIAHGDHADSA